MKTQLKAAILKTLMKLPGLSRFWLQNKIFLDNGLNLFLGGYSGDILIDTDERPIGLEFIVDQFREDELDFSVELPDLHALEVPGLELAHHISVVGEHRFEEPKMPRGVLIEGDLGFEPILVQVVLELVLPELDVVAYEVFSNVSSRHLLFPSG